MKIFKNFMYSSLIILLALFCCAGCLGNGSNTSVNESVTSKSLFFDATSQYPVFYNGSSSSYVVIRNKSNIDINNIEYMSNNNLLTIDNGQCSVVKAYSKCELNFKVKEFNDSSNNAVMITAKYIQNNELLQAKHLLNLVDTVVPTTNGLSITTSNLLTNTDSVMYLYVGGSKNEYYTIESMLFTDGDVMIKNLNQITTAHTGDVIPLQLHIANNDSSHVNLSTSLTDSTNIKLNQTFSLGSTNAVSSVVNISSPIAINAANTTAGTSFDNFTLTWLGGNNAKITNVSISNSLTSGGAISLLSGGGLNCTSATGTSINTILSNSNLTCSIYLQLNSKSTTGSAVVNITYQDVVTNQFYNLTQNVQVYSSPVNVARLAIIPAQATLSTFWNSTPTESIQVINTGNTPLSGSFSISSSNGLNYYALNSSNCPATIAVGTSCYLTFNGTIPAAAPANLTNDVARIQFTGSNTYQSYKTVNGINLTIYPGNLTNTLTTMIGGGNTSITKTVFTTSSSSPANIVQGNGFNIELSVNDPYLVESVIVTLSNFSALTESINGGFSISFAATANGTAGANSCTLKATGTGAPATCFIQVLNKWYNGHPITENVSFNLVATGTSGYESYSNSVIIKAIKPMTYLAQTGQTTSGPLPAASSGYDGYYAYGIPWQYISPNNTNAVSRFGSTLVPSTRFGYVPNNPNCIYDYLTGQMWFKTSYYNNATGTSTNPSVAYGWTKPTAGSIGAQANSNALCGYSSGWHIANIIENNSLLNGSFFFAGGPTSWVASWLNGIISGPSGMISAPWSITSSTAGTLSDWTNIANSTPYIGTGTSSCPSGNCWFTTPLYAANQSNPSTTSLPSSSYELSIATTLQPVTTGQQIFVTRIATESNIYNNAPSKLVSPGSMGVESGIQWPSPRYVNDPTTSCLIDVVTGLIYPKNMNFANSRGGNEAQQMLNIVNSANTVGGSKYGYCGLTNWRAANKYEALNLVNYEADTIAYLTNAGFADAGLGQNWLTSSYINSNYLTTIFNGSLNSAYYPGVITYAGTGMNNYVVVVGGGN